MSTTAATKRKEAGIRNNREELIERINYLLPEDGELDMLNDFRISRLSKPSETRHMVYDPCFCFIIQGSKTVKLNGELLRYNPGNYLITTVDLPVSVCVEKANEEEPYLGFRMNLQPAHIAAVFMDSGIKMKKGDAKVKAISVSPVDSDLLDAIVRLFRVFDSSDESKVLVSLTVKEIIYRLLIGGQGARLGHLLANRGDSHRISKAIRILQKNFNQPLRIDELARELGMSVSGFHHHFKSVTTISPIQFQKHLRLQEARKLMLGEELDAADASFRVGYSDPSHFSRDYKKHFGLPPKHDIEMIRNTVAVSA
ncbi:MAG: AraC family transcriptional regulator N-terminal domain-containing protein [Pyrinomonadaceae bacterium]